MSLPLLVKVKVFKVFLFQTATRVLQEAPVPISFFLNPAECHVKPSD